MNIKKELFNHLVFEFAGSFLPSNQRVLTEKRGRVENVDLVVNCLCNKMRKQINRVINTKTQETKTYNGKISDDGIDTFFNDYNIVLTIVYEPGTNKENMINYSGGITPATSFSNVSDSQTGNFISIKCHPHINLKIGGQNFSNIFYTLRFALGHEITHAFNLYQFGKKNGRTLDGIIANYMYTQGYRNISRAKEEKAGNPQAIARILYLLNRMERNAYIAQLKQELTDRKDEIYDAKSAADTIKSTQSFKKFINLKRNVSIINIVSNEAVQKEILDTTNEITGKNFKTYNQVQKFYSRIWSKWRKKYIITAAKMAKDVYDINHFDMSDDLSSEEIVLKID